MKFQALYLLLLMGALTACGGAPQFSQEGEIKSSTQGVTTSSSSAATSGSSKNSIASAASSSKSASSKLSSSASSKLSSSASSKSSSSASSQSSASTCNAVPALSHRAGENCMTCHKTGGTGAANGIFTVAGTLYKSNGVDPQPQSIVKLFAQNTNVVNVCLRTDALGNFYTSQVVAGLPTPGVNAVVESAAGGVITMDPTLPISGACNSCHGVVFKKLMSD